MVVDAPLPATTSWLPETFDCSDSCIFCTRCARASVAAISSINASPAFDFVAEPTAVAAIPTACASQTQAGARFLYLGNKQFFAFLTVAVEESVLDSSPHA